jgi:recombination DNA repair RAD52 pathway protein
MIIEEVNNIFGPDGWSSSVTNMTQDFVRNVSDGGENGASTVQTALRSRREEKERGRETDTRGQKRKKRY